MSELPLVTIVTPSYNQGPYLERTILSVLSQDYPNIEYMVIDGGSTDESVSIIKKYADRIAFWKSEKDRGQSDAINSGWKKAKGIYCSYLNSDDALAPGAVSKIVNAFRMNPGAGIVYGDYTFIDVGDKVLETSRGRQVTFKQLLVDGQMPAIAQPSSFYLTSLVRKVGFIDESLHLSMDYDLLLKIARISPIVYIPDQISLFRLHGLSKTSTFALRHWHETLKVKMKYNRLYMLKSLFIYLRFRVFHFLPDAWKLKIRLMRNSVHDKIIMNSKEQSGTG